MALNINGGGREIREIESKVNSMNETCGASYY